MTDNTQPALTSERLLDAATAVYRRDAHSLYAIRTMAALAGLSNATWRMAHPNGLSDEEAAEYDRLVQQFDDMWKQSLARKEQAR